MPSLMESFNWLGPEFALDDRGDKNTVWIKGVAMRDNVLSRNRRKYVKDELVKAARTWMGKPVTVNHDMNKKVGHVEWMEYDDGALEYLAKITRQPYVNLLRDKSAEIQGVSIEAGYLHNKCPQCDERFYTEEEFINHMNDEHFVKIDEATYEPHGIIGQALSIVLSPEEAGYPDTSIELLETYKKPVLQLLETVITTVKEEKNYLKKLKGKAVVKPKQHITIDEAKRLEEQEPETPPLTEPGEIEPEKDEDDKAPPTHPVETEPPPATSGPTPETEGEEAETSTEPTETDHIPPETKVVSEQDVTPPAVADDTGALDCPEGFEYDPGSKTCIATPIPETPPPTPAPTVEEPEIPIDLVTTTEQVEVPSADVQGDAPDTTADSRKLPQVIML